MRGGVGLPVNSKDQSPQRDIRVFPQQRGACGLSPRACNRPADPSGNLRSAVAAGPLAAQRTPFCVLSGRALARAALRRECPIFALSIAEWIPKSDFTTLGHCLRQQVGAKTIFALLRAVFLWAVTRIAPTQCANLLHSGLEEPRENLSVSGLCYSGGGNVVFSHHRRSAYLAHLDGYRKGSRESQDDVAQRGHRSMDA